MGRKYGRLPYGRHSYDKWNTPWNPLPEPVEPWTPVADAVEPWTPVSETPEPWTPVSPYNG